MRASFHNVLYTGPFGTATIPKVFTICILYISCLFTLISCFVFSSKVFSNLLCAVNMIAAGEAMMVAKKGKLETKRFFNFCQIFIIFDSIFSAGLDLKTFWDAIRSSSGNSFVWETGGPFVMQGMFIVVSLCLLFISCLFTFLLYCLYFYQGNYDPSFDIELHCKDNQLCYDIAKEHKVN